MHADQVSRNLDCFLGPGDDPPGSLVGWGRARRGGADGVHEILNKRTTALHPINITNLDTRYIPSMHLVYTWYMTFDLKERFHVKEVST